MLIQSGVGGFSCCGTEELRFCYKETLENICSSVCLGFMESECARVNVEIAMGDILLAKYLVLQPMLSSASLVCKLWGEHRVVFVIEMLYRE